MPLHEISGVKAPDGFSVYRDDDGKQCYFSVAPGKGLVLPTDVPRQPEDGSIYFDGKAKTLSVYQDGKPYVFKAYEKPTAVPVTEPAPVVEKPATDKATTPAVGKAKAVSTKARGKHAKSQKLDVVAEPRAETPEDTGSLEMDLSDSEYHHQQHQQHQLDATDF